MHLMECNYTEAKGSGILGFHFPAIRYYAVSLLSGLDSKQMAFL